MTGAQYFLARLACEGMRHLFLVPGAHLDPLLHEISEQTVIEPIICAHEAGAGFMADGYGRVSNHMGVVASIGGPGAANLLPSVITARVEEKPLLVVTGDVLSAWSHMPSFQNAGRAWLADQTLMEPHVKLSLRIDAAETLPVLLGQAIKTALTPPRGPVHIQVPYDVWESIIASGDRIEATRLAPTPAKPRSTFDPIWEILQSSERPVFYVGSDFPCSPMTSDRLLDIAKHTGVPIVTTLCGLDRVDTEHAMSYGVAGFGGSPRANALLSSSESDATIMLGVTINERNLDSWNANILHVGKRIIIVHDTEPSAIICERPNITWIRAPLETLVDHLDASSLNVAPNIRQSRRGWLEEIIQLREASSNLSRMVSKVRDLLPHHVPMFVDAGSAKALIGQSWQSTMPSRLFTSHDFGSMGWAICAAIGAATSGSPTAVITGDGSMRMLGMELSTATRYQLPVLFILINNGTMGSIMQRFLDDHRMHSVLKFPDMDWGKISDGMGVAAYKATDVDQVQLAFEKIFPLTKPCLLELEVIRVRYS